MLRRLLVVLVSFVLAPAAFSQGVQMRVLDARADGVTLEATAIWPTPLQAALTSADAVQMDSLVLHAITRGLTTTAETIELPTLAAPRVQILASDYDEAPLASSDALPSGVDGPVAEVVGLGVFRKQPVANVQVRLVSYDAGREMLRRYRRLVLHVTFDRAARSTAPFARSLVQDNPHLLVERSVLADGTVYKIPITQEGIYHIDRAFMSNLPGLSSAGSIDPNRVQVFGNSGAPVPAHNSAPRIPDLAELAVFVRGGGDGAFNDGDAVLFYANGPSGWHYGEERDRNGNLVREGWSHYTHPFDNENYVFIRIADAQSKRVGDGSYPDYAESTRLTQVEGRHFVDPDEYMWSREAGTGYTWVSNRIFGGGTRSLLDNVRLPGLGSGMVRYEARPVVRSNNPIAEVYFISGGVELNSLRLGGLFTCDSCPVAHATTTTFEQTVNAGQSLNLTMNLQDLSSDPEAAIDWLRVLYPQDLQAQDGLLRFATPGGEAGRFTFVLSGFPQEPQVWDVTEPNAIHRLGVRAEGGSYLVQVEVTDRLQPREIIAFTESAVRSLDADAFCSDGATCTVGPQNLHGISQYPDFVIVTPSVFRAQAEELAEIRRADGLRVEVSDVDQIYNEFSGGQLDPRGLRDYFRFLYDRAPDDASRLRYVLLFGDGHFDYRNISAATELTNWIPPFETEESFNPDHSFTSDDYFGLLDPDEGEWPYVRSTHNNEELNEFLDLGIGRFTVQTVSEAQTIIEKVRRYESPETFGPWRARYVFVGDDGYNGLSFELEDRPDLHTQNIDVVAERVAQVEPALNQTKVYSISYERVFRNGYKVPEAKEDLLTAIREGALVVNYSGHGGEFGLAQEEVFTREDARSLSNRNKLPVFVTATCSFGRWDLANEQTGAEVLLSNPDGGGIALLTTVRTVYTNTSILDLNVGLNYQLNYDLFQRDENGLMRRLGESLLATKNTNVGNQGNNRKFNLLGDPTMRLGYPPQKTVVTSVNGTPVQEQTGQVRALETITVRGEVQTVDGMRNGGFDGEVTVTVYDAQRQIPIDPMFVSVLNNRPYYVVREDLIWRGKVQAQAGQFEAQFVVPKDISYSDQPGRISAYAASDQTHANGFTENVIVGGTTDNPPDDAQGPEIDVFVESEAFVSGGMTSPRPQVLVKLFDDTGINTVGAGVGHEMLLIIDGDEMNAIEIGDLYESEPNSFQRGQVVYQFEEDLTPGPHTLEVRAWDVLNNSGEAAIDLTVSDADGIALANVFNYPNPTTGPTRFVFEHNQPLGTPASVQIRIYSIAGQPVATIERDEILAGGPVQIVWDGRDDDLDPLAPGIYLYKVRVEVDGLDGERHVSEQLEKLAVIR